MVKAYCDICKKTVNVIENFEPMEIRTANDEKISIIGNVGTCSICNTDLEVPEFTLLNYEQAAHIIEMKEKY